MSADQIRRAATVLRERAQKATPGPWRDSSTEDGIRFGALVADQRHPDRRPGGGWDWDDGYGGCLVGESHMAADRAYLATVDPSFGAAVADLLEALAGEMPNDTYPRAGSPLHAIVQQLLGEA